MSGKQYNPEVVSRVVLHPFDRFIDKTFITF